MFVIEDEIHCDWHGEYATLTSALAELHRRAGFRWDESPNVAPCTNWQTCGRNYVIIEFDHSKSTWEELRRIPALKIDPSGVEWLSGFGVSD